MTKPAKIITICLLSLCLLFVFLNVNQASAALQGKFGEFLNQAGTAGTYNTTNQGQAGYINPLIGTVINTIVSFIGLIFLAMVVFSGIQWMTSGGNEETISKAKKRVINSTIGVGLTLAAFVVTNLVYNYFDQKFLDEYPIQTGSPPYEQIACTSDTTCADRPQTPYCLNGVCVQCKTTDDCDKVSCVNGFCGGKDTECSSLFKDTCLFTSSSCRWENLGGGGWEGGSCVDKANASCQQQCTQDAPICFNGGCVECTVNSDCGALNSCNQDHVCRYPW